MFRKNSACSGAVGTEIRTTSAPVFIFFSFRGKYRDVHSIERAVISIGHFAENRHGRVAKRGDQILVIRVEREYAFSRPCGARRRITTKIKRTVERRHDRSFMPESVLSVYILHI